MEINYHLSYYITAKYSDEILSFIWLDTIVLVFFKIPVEHLTQKYFLIIYIRVRLAIYILSIIFATIVCYTLLCILSNSILIATVTWPPNPMVSSPAKADRRGRLARYMTQFWWMNCLTANACHILFNIMTNFVHFLIGWLPCNEGLSHW